MKQLLQGHWECEFNKNILNSCKYPEMCIQIVGNTILVFYQANQANSAWPSLHVLAK